VRGEAAVHPLVTSRPSITRIIPEEDFTMRLDIFRRPESEGKFSYLAIPEGNNLPEEVTNIDWESTATGVDIEENQHELEQYAIHEPLEQISAKGYAITSVKDVKED
jgi:hypothetical protein